MDTGFGGLGVSSGEADVKYGLASPLRMRKMSCLDFLNVVQIARSDVGRGMQKRDVVYTHSIEVCLLFLR